MIKYSEEKIEDIMHDIGELTVLHKQELRGDQFELDINWGAYEGLEDRGMLHITTARDDGILIGYSAFILVQLIHYQKEYIASNDVFFIHKDYRKGLIGYKLLRTSINFIKKIGMKNFAISVKIKQDYPRLFKRLGFEPKEIVYMMEV